MSFRRRASGALPLLGLLAACNSDHQPLVCTTLYALIPVVVVNSGGSPVAGMTITDSILRTHEKFTVPQTEGIYPLGTYHVMTDSYVQKLRESGDAVRVSGSNGTLSFAADFTFGVPGGCHVSKLAGPDTVVAR